jgi:hypothetical protein
MDSLSTRNPLKLLAQMLKLCPRGQEGNEFSLYLFLQPLPKELRIMLGKNPEHDARALATKPFKLWVTMAISILLPLPHCLLMMTGS